MRVSVVMKYRLFWAAALTGVLFDRLTKVIVERSMSLGQSIPLWPNVFHLTYVENTGAAWSLFENSGGFLRWVSLVVAIGLLVFIWCSAKLNRWEQLGYGCLWAGAVGNGIDRFVSGAVTDFFHFVLINFPVFNIADIAINVGVVALLLGFREQTLAASAEPKEPEAKP